jgi:hypothetical protein
MSDKENLTSISYCIKLLENYEKCMKKNFNNCNIKLKDFDTCIFLYLSS